MAATPKALEGLRVLDLTRVVAGPMCSQMLADLGADVIKIERPGVGDDMRRMGGGNLHDHATGAEISDHSPYYVAFNRSKRSVSVNLANIEGAEVVRALAAHCDVFIENYKAGDLGRYGLDYDRIRAVNSSIVYCSISGYGQTGPHAHRPAFDGSLQAVSGLWSINGEPDGEPQRVGVHIIDYLTGLNASTAILGALYSRDANGGAGQYIDIGMQDCAIAALSLRTQHYLVTGEVPRRSGNGIQRGGPVRLFRCRDGDVSVSAAQDAAFARLCAALDVSQAAEDPRFKLAAKRAEHLPELFAILEPIFAASSIDEMSDRLERGGVVYAPIKTIPQALEDRQSIYRGVLVEVEHPRAGPLKLLRNPVRYSGTPIEDYAPPPAVGEHTDEVLGELLGYDASRIAGLRKAGAI